MKSPRHLPALLLVTALAACNGPRVADGSDTGEGEGEVGGEDPEWMLGEYVRGEIDAELGDSELLLWLEITADGTWAYGLRGCSDSHSPSASGTWEIRDDETIELIEGDEGFGALAGGADPVVKLSKTSDCEVIELDDGEDAYIYSRGVACMKGCSSGSRELYWCDGPPTCP